MISIVIPILNEEEVISQLYQRIAAAAEHWGDSLEVILVDDGSSDSSHEIIEDIHNRDPRFKAIFLSRNFGHQAAISAGLQYASGDAVLIMDADLQDPPEVVGALLEKWREGYEVVYAIRTRRTEGVVKRTAYWLFYRVMAWTTNIRIPLDAGDFCLMDKCVVSLINNLPERNRFVRGLRSWAGFSQIGVPYERHSRRAGKPKYGFGSLLKLALDGILSFSYRPMQLFGVFGIIVALASFFGLLFFFLAIAMKWKLTSLGLGQIPGLFPIICVIVFIGGIQLIGLGIFGEYLGRVYDEVKGRPLFLVKRSLGLPIESKTANSDHSSAKER